MSPIVTSPCPNLTPRRLSTASVTATSSRRNLTLSPNLVLAAVCCKVFCVASAMTRSDPHSYTNDKHPLTSLADLKLKIEFDQKRISGSVRLVLEREVTRNLTCVGWFWKGFVQIAFFTLDDPLLIFCVPWVILIVGICRQKAPWI